MDRIDNIDISDHARICCTGTPVLGRGRYAVVLVQVLCRDLHSRGRLGMACDNDVLSLNGICPDIVHCQLQLEALTMQLKNCDFP